MTRRILAHIWICRGVTFTAEAEALAFRDMFYKGGPVVHFREVPPKPKGKKNGRRKLGRVDRIRPGWNAL